MFFFVPLDTKPGGPGGGAKGFSGLFFEIWYVYNPQNAMIKKKQ